MFKKKKNGAFEAKVELLWWSVDTEWMEITTVFHCEGVPKLRRLALSGFQNYELGSR